MSQVVKLEQVDLKTLVNTNSPNTSLNFRSKIVDELNNNFTEDEKKWYIANLYIYLNYHPTNDFPIDLENVYKLIGFTNKKNAKRTLINNFTKDEDYKITTEQGQNLACVYDDTENGNKKPASAYAEAVNLAGENLAAPYGVADDLSFETILLPREQNKLETRGRKEETILLNVDTFKNMCMITKTQKSKEIRSYYVKLEKIFNKLTNEEIMEHKRKLKESEEKILLLDYKLEENKQLLLEKEIQLKENAKLINDLELKPETEGFSSRVPGEIYCIRDTTKSGHIKIGITDKTITRVDQLNVGSSTRSLNIYTTFDTFDRNLAEKLIHHSLHPFRIKNRKEWFYFKNDHELAYAISTIKKSLEYIKQFDIKNIAHFKESTINLDINVELINVKQELQENRDNKIKEQKKVNKLSIEKSGAQTGTFKGVCWIDERKQWCAQLQHDYKNTFLGYYTDEIDGAKVYNDYAAYLNQTENTNFYINDIPGYITVPRNVPEENKKQIQENKTSKYNGVSYDSKRKYFVAGIKCSGITYNLGNNVNEIDCARLYNQQALYFNNVLNTKYVLNDIGEETIARDFRTELLKNKESKKSSKFYGVSITSTKKWAASYMMNRKKIHIGTFNTELEACKAYNKIVIDLNKNGCNYKVNQE